MNYTKPIVETNLRRWTQSAKECLERGCVCENCFFEDFFKGTSHKCDMKITVLALVKRLGHPKDVKVKTILEEKV